MVINDLSVEFNCRDFRYNLWFIPIKGFANIKMTQVKLEIDVRLNTHKDKKGRTLMAFDVLKADMSLNAKKLGFDLGGGILADFVDFFMPLFRGAIKIDIERKVEAQLKNDLPNNLNAQLSADNGFFEPFTKFPQFKNLTIDYSVEIDPSINGTYLGIGLNGTVINFDKKHYKPASDPIMMPFHNYKVKSRI